MRLLAVVLAAVTAALLVPPGAAPDARASLPDDPPDRFGRARGGAAGALGQRVDVGRVAARLLRPGPSGAVATVLVGAVLAVVLHGLRLVLALLVAGTALAVATLVRRSRAAREAERRRALVVEVSEALVGELRAGQPLVASLEHCVGTWPEMATVAAAARLGADVSSALRRLASAPGAEGLSEVASAWQVAERSGAGLATALAEVARTARARAGTRDVVRGELASAQATARLVAVLPLASLGMSAGIGGHPWRFLLDSGPGLACLSVGVVLAFTGLWWIDRIAAAVLRA